ncbi:MAG: thioesterase family protein [Chlamydiales bacterium]
MFRVRDKVRMHDTDMAGIIYFASQFRFAHDAWEDFLEHEGITLQRLFTDEDYAFVIVHAEADYLAPLNVGDSIEVRLGVDKIGSRSFAVEYKILKEQVVVGTVKIVHSTVNRETRRAIPIPESLREILEKYALARVRQ